MSGSIGLTSKSPGLEKGIEFLEQYKGTKAPDASTTTIKSIAMVEQLGRTATRKTYSYGKPQEDADALNMNRNDTSAARVAKVSAKA